MMRLATGMAVLALFGLCTAALAKEKGPKAPKGEKPLAGEVVSVTPADATKPDEGGTIKVTSGGKKAPKETDVAYDKDTKVTINGVDSKVSDLKAGMRVTITPATGTAKEIKAAAGAKKGGKKHKE